MKILIIRLSSLGDVLLSSLLIRCLRGRYPEGRIDFLVRERYADLVKKNEYLSDFLMLAEPAGRRELKVTAEVVKAGKYDYIIDIQGNFRSWYIGWRSGGKILRWEKPRLKRWLLVNFKWNLLKGYASIAERYLKAAEALGVVDDGLGLDFFIGEAEEAEGDRLFRQWGCEGPTTAAIAPGSRWRTKQWEGENYAQLCVRLLKSNLKGIILLGSVEEAARCKEIQEVCGEGIVNLAGKTSIGLSAALIKRCGIFIGNDSGLSHLASAVGTPSVVFFGCTVKEWGFFPFRSRSIVLEKELDCRPCTHIGRNRCPKKHFRCMKEITVEEALEATGRILLAKGLGNGD